MSDIGNEGNGLCSVYIGWLERKMVGDGVGRGMGVMDRLFKSFRFFFFFCFTLKLSSSWRSGKKPNVLLTSNIFVNIWKYPEVGDMWRKLQKHSLFFFFSFRGWLHCETGSADELSRPLQVTLPLSNSPLSAADGFSSPASCLLLKTSRCPTWVGGRGWGGGEVNRSFVCIRWFSCFAQSVMFTV